MFEGRPQAAAAGAVRDVLRSGKTKQREVGWGQGGAVKKMGEAGMGRLVSHGPALYREERVRGGMNGKVSGPCWTVCCIEFLSKRASSEWG